MLPDNAVRRIAFDRAMANLTGWFFFAAALLVLGLLFLAGSAWAQPVSTSVTTSATAQPVWLTLVLGLAPYLITGAIGLILSLHIGTWLRADSAKRKGGVIAAIEGVGAVIADDVDALLTKDGGSLKDLLDPTKRAAAEATLAADGIAAAKASASAAVDAALKRSL